MNAQTNQSSPGRLMKRLVTPCLAIAVLVFAVVAIVAGGAVAECRAAESKPMKIEFIHLNCVRETSGSGSDEIAVVTLAANFATGYCHASITLFNGVDTGEVHYPDPAAQVALWNDVQDIDDVVVMVMMVETNDTPPFSFPATRYVGNWLSDQAIPHLKNQIAIHQTATYPFTRTKKVNLVYTEMGRAFTFYGRNRDDLLGITELTFPQGTIPSSGSKDTIVNMLFTGYGSYYIPVFKVRAGRALYYGSNTGPGVPVPSAPPHVIGEITTLEIDPDALDPVMAEGSGLEEIDYSSMEMFVGGFASICWNSEIGHSPTTEQFWLDLFTPRVDLSGHWIGLWGIPCTIHQDGVNLVWEAPMLGEWGGGRFEGPNRVSAMWINPFGVDAGEGTIFLDGNGRAFAILWENGVVFYR